jgi:hypothetical protein
VFPRRGCRPGYTKVSPPKGSGAPKSANLWCPRSLRDRGGRLSARRMRRFFRYTPGRAFAASVPLSILSSRWGSFSPRRAPSGKGDRKRLAIDLTVVSQLLAGTLSGPGRSPGAARVPDPRDQTRGRRTPSRLNDRLAMAPFTERSTARILGCRSAGIRFSWGSWRPERVAHLEV